MFRLKKRACIFCAMIKTYTELIKLPTFEERFNYLKLDGIVGTATFGNQRYLNQVLYHSSDWKRIKSKLMLRDAFNGFTCDLAFADRPIIKLVYLHHINPITVADILQRRPNVFDEENLVCVSFMTHQAIHFGDYSLIQQDYIPRRPNDTCLWR